MTDESKALPDWKPEDGCVPDEWLVALRDGHLTEAQGNPLGAHRGCSECVDRYRKFVSDVTGKWLSRAASSGAESLMTWTPEDGCIPIELLFALDNGMFRDETELRLFGHIATCRKCERRLNSLSHDPILDQFFDRPLPVITLPGEET
jgi:hypothetical protein